MTGIPEDRLLNPWAFHLMGPEEQQEYERGLHALRQSIIDQQNEEMRIAKEKALEMEKRRYISNMEKRLAEPSSSAHWHEMRELMTNVSAHKNLKFLHHRFIGCLCAYVPVPAYRWVYHIHIYINPCSPILHIYIYI